jgi:hypothetical protein
VRQRGQTKTRSDLGVRLSEVFDPEGLQSERGHEAHFLRLARYGVAPVCTTSTCESVRWCSGWLADVHDTDVHIFVRTAIQQDLLSRAALLGCQWHVQLKQSGTMRNAHTRTRCTEQDDRPWDIVLLECSSQRERDTDTRHGDEVVSARMADPRQRVHFRIHADGASPDMPRLNSARQAVARPR